MADALEAPALRPLLRGYLHELAFFATIPAGAVLISDARDHTARTAAIWFSAGLFALYGVSTAFHRITWTPTARARMRRADHSTIFVMIAATYTAVALLIFDRVWQRGLLGVVWTGALVGVALKIAAPVRTRKITGAMYIVLGWAAVAAAPKLVATVSRPVLTLIVAGGLLYTGGAIVFALRRPDPSPRVFGYHEIWHAATVAASACHYVAIRMLLTAR